MVAHEQSQLKMEVPSTRVRFALHTTPQHLETPDGASVHLLEASSRGTEEVAYCDAPTELARESPPNHVRRNLHRVTPQT